MRDVPASCAIYVPQYPSVIVTASGIVGVVRMIVPIAEDIVRLIWFFAGNGFDETFTIFNFPKIDLLR